MTSLYERRNCDRVTQFKSSEVTAAQAHVSSGRRETVFVQLSCMVACTMVVRRKSIVGIEYRMTGPERGGCFICLEM